MAPDQRYITLCVRLYNALCAAIVHPHRDASRSLVERSSEAAGLRIATVAGLQMRYRLSVLRCRLNRLLRIALNRAHMYRAIFLVQRLELSEEKNFFFGGLLTFEPFDETACYNFGTFLFCFFSIVSVLNVKMKM